VRFAVSCDGDTWPEPIHDRLPPGTRLCRPGGDPAFTYSVRQDHPHSEGDSVHVVSLDGVDLQRSYDVAPALELFESTLRFEVVRRARRWTFVHAGVVGWHGVAIVMPGVSWSGKSTLVRALVEAGATYYSDEYAAIDSRGRVYPFAQPLMHRTESGDRLRLRPADFGGTVGASPLPIGLVVATHFLADAEWNPVTLSSGSTVLAMLGNTVRAQADPARSLRVLSKVAEHADAVETPRGDAAPVVVDILRRAELSRSHARSIA
jgi:hypothetical protein